MPITSEQLLQFWFHELEPRQWWAVDRELDHLLERRYGSLLVQAAAGELFPWRASAQGRLAEVIVLDQFSRNIHRGTPRAFGQDAQALALAQEAVAAGALQALSEVERPFLLMPYMHSESHLVHMHAEALYLEFTPASTQEFERRHKAIIDRFDRYPHRNQILGRESSPEEIEFLRQPGSSF